MNLGFFLQTPTIPYLGTFLTDLIMLDTALPDFVEVSIFERGLKQGEGECGERANNCSHDTWVGISNYLFNPIWFEILNICEWLYFLPNIIRRRDASYIEEWLACNFGLLQCDVSGITLEAGKESAACTKCHSYSRRKPTFHKQSTLFWRHCTKVDASPLLIQIQAICYEIQGPIQYRNWVSDGILVPLWTCLPVHLYRTVFIEDVIFAGHPCLYICVYELGRGELVSSCQGTVFVLYQIKCCPVYHVSQYLVYFLKYHQIVSYFSGGPQLSEFSVCYLNSF